MINAIAAFSPTATSAATLQARLDALRATQRAGGDTNAREASLRAAEQNGARAAYIRGYDTSLEGQAQLEDAIGQRQARNLRGQALQDDASVVSGPSDSGAAFQLSGLAERPEQTIAGLRNPQPSLDSASFVALFAQARPGLALVADNAALPFRQATATLARHYGAGDDAAIDLAA